MTENAEEKIMEVVRARIRIHQLEDDLRKARHEHQYLADCLSLEECRKYLTLYRDSQL